MQISEEIQLATAIASLNSGDFPIKLNAWLQTCLPYDNITILAYFPNQLPVSMMFENRQPKVHENIIQVYLVGAYLLDPFHDLHVNQAPAGVYRLSEIAPDKFRRNQYFVEYYGNTTCVDASVYASDFRYRTCDRVRSCVRPQRCDTSHGRGPVWLVRELGPNQWIALEARCGELVLLIRF